MAAFLDTEAEVKGVTAGRITPPFRSVGVLTRVGGGSLDPNAGDLAVTAGWGHAGGDGATMPGKGRWCSANTTRTNERPSPKGPPPAGSPSIRRRCSWAEATLDVYLNDVAYWKNIPANVWQYTIGGYQVMKKWLSYREQDVLGRTLREEEVREAMNIARRLSAIVLLQPALDENYRAIRDSAFDWQSLAAAVE